VPTFEPGDVFAGHRIESVAGRGGMGVVYRAVDLALERTVALKLIAPEFASDAAFRARFQRESRVAASIRHPNVITIYHAGDEDGLLYTTMDFVHGTDMGDAIAAAGRLEPRVATALVAQVGSALDAAHARGLVHRDVKPANVLIPTSPAGHAYLTDFGLTKHHASQSGLTESGVIVGTLDYIAPEQVSGGQVDARADVYALGCVLFHALTGDVPFPRDTNVAKMYAHTSVSPPAVSDAVPGLPVELDAMVARALAKDPADRYQSAGDLARAAAAAVEGRSPADSERTVATGDTPNFGRAEQPPPSSAPPEPSPEPRNDRSRRTARLVAVPAVLAAGLLIAVFASIGSPDGSDHPAQAPRTSSQSHHTTAVGQAAPADARLQIVPTAATYLCVDRGLGTAVIYQGTTVGPRTFEGKRLRVNIGNASTVEVSVNGKHVELPRAATTVGYEFTSTRSMALPAGQRRPCG
jgi:serine/threonine protein kinase